jgi:hypothetical protein
MSKYRVWNVVNPPSTPDFYPVESPREGYELIEKLASMQLRSSLVVSNAFGFEVFEDGEWGEWYSEDGENIDEWAAGRYREETR